jgi:hypothetical protein
MNIESQISFIQNSVDCNRPISLVRYAHGFWDKVAESNPNLHSQRVDSRKVAKNFSAYVSKNYKWKPTEFVIYENIEMMKMELVNLHVAVSAGGSPRDEHKKNKAIYYKMYKKFGLPEQLFDALIFKKMALRGGMTKFIKSLRDYNVVFVGPNYRGLSGGRFGSEQFGRVLGIDNYRHINIHPTEGYSAAKQVYGEICNLKFENNLPKCFLFSAGATANYWIYKLHNKNIAHLLNIGKAMEILVPNMSPNRMPYWLRNSKSGYENLQNKLRRM